MNREEIKPGAYLRDADLSGANLSDADLRGAYLRDANLRDADLSGANLSDADLSGANLRDANLRVAYLRGANLRDADLRDAYLRDADLRGAYLRDANLSDAYLRGANLRDADLRGAYLRDADLSGAYLRDADLRDAKDIPPLTAARLSVLPDEGDVIGWKKCMYGVIVKLLIKDGVARSNATGRKCRAQSAIVLDVIGADVARSQHDHAFTYTKGETVSVDNFDHDRWVECASGIHFYITRAEAEAN